MRLAWRIVLKLLAILVCLMGCAVAFAVPVFLLTKRPIEAAIGAPVAYLLFKSGGRLWRWGAPVQSDPVDLSDHEKARANYLRHLSSLGYPEAPAVEAVDQYLRMSEFQKQKVWESKTMAGWATVMGLQPSRSQLETVSV